MISPKSIAPRLIKLPEIPNRVIPVTANRNDSGMADATINAAWRNQKITYDPITSSIAKSSDDAFSLGFLDKKPDLAGIYALDPLNKVLKQLNLPAVKSS